MQVHGATIPESLPLDGMRSMRVGWAERKLRPVDGPGGTGSSLGFRFALQAKSGAFWLLPYFTLDTQSLGILKRVGEFFVGFVELLCHCVSHFAAEEN